MIGPYQTTKAFRVALEERLKRIASEQHTDLMRLRRQVAFDRLLARLFITADVPWVLKGGYTFEVRLGGRARVTKDIDLSVPDLRRLFVADEESSNPDAVIRERLQEMAAASIGDGFTFRIGMPMADLDAAPYGGARYLVEARLDSRTFATFHLDVGIGDAAVAEPEWLIGQDTLAFAGIPPTRVAALAREQQFAEKIHAYTLPRGDRTNTRVKDLVDLVLLIEIGMPDIATLQRAILATFTRRATHEAPIHLPAPPDEWRMAFERMAADVALSASTIDTAFTIVATFWEKLTL